jgi:UDP-N-acetylglucosamine 3-dehydrogenase
MEKPIAGTPLDSAQMVDIANQENVLLYVGHSMKFEPAIQKIREILDAGVLGAVTEVRIVRTVKSRNDAYYPNAALYQIGVHLLDVLLYLFKGDLVCGRLCRNTRDNVDEVTFTRENININLRYGFSTLYNFSLYLAGENGHILLADGVLKTIINGKETVYQIPMKNEKTICSQLDEFYCAVRKGEPFLNTKENAERIISLCEQITKTGENV